MMCNRQTFLRLFALWFAVLAYAGNGAQAHVVESADGTLLIPICSTDGTRMVEVSLGDEPPVETSDTKCGNCLVFAAPVPDPIRLTNLTVWAKPRLAHMAYEAVSPRSPLWPGAPPVGPPLSLG